LFSLYDAAGRAPELEPRLRAALRREPRSAMHHNWLGLVLRRRGDLEGAEAEFRRTLQVAPDLVGAMANLGSLYLQQQRHAEAVAVLRRALEKDARNVESRTNLIVALGMTRDLDGARLLVDEALRAGHRASLYHNALAYVLHLNGRNEEALEEIRRSLEIDPRQPDALRLRAEIEQAGPAPGLPYR
jgi:Flp pilus assembly protein TadD